MGSKHSITTWQLGRKWTRKVITLLEIQFSKTVLHWTDEAVVRCPDPSLSESSSPSCVLCFCSSPHMSAIQTEITISTLHFNFLYHVHHLLCLTLGYSATVGVLEWWPGMRWKSSSSARRFTQPRYDAHASKLHYMHMHRAWLNTYWAKVTSIYGISRLYWNLIHT